MRFQLLGPVLAWADAGPVNLGVRQQRFVLAVLALEVNRLMPMERLIDLVWPNDPPGSARGMIHTHISGLRAILRDCRAELHGIALQHKPAGYELTCEPTKVDAHLFEELVSQARSSDDEPGRLALLDQALGLWRGPALAGVTDEDIRLNLCRHLDEGLLVATEDRVEALLRLGRHHEVIDNLIALSTAHTDRQRMTGQLMRALHRAGRTSEALRTYERARHRLADELGLDPSTELRHLHRAILRDDPELAVATSAPQRPAPLRPASEVSAPAALRLSEREAADLMAAARGRPASGQVPHQLPAMVAGLTGRAQQLRQLDSLLEPGQRTAVVIGPAGVGKTVLAIAWAHKRAGDFPDGQIYVNLRGFDPSAGPASITAVTRAMLDALGIPPRQRPATTEAQLALYRSLLTHKRTLLVLDNAHEADQVRPLLPGSPGCAVVVTSRNRLTSLVATEGAFVVTADLLSDVESRELLRGRLGSRINAEPEAVEAIIRYCQRLPLALSIAAARAATHPLLPLSSIAVELADIAGRLTMLGTGDAQTDVRTVFSWSYERLGPGAARMFRLLGWHPGAEFDVHAAASLADISMSQTHALLDETARYHLINPTGTGRYTLHDLLRLYAREMAHDQASSIRRLVDHYLHTAIVADRLLYPSRDQEPTGKCTEGVILHPLSTHNEAMAWFEAETDTLLSMVDVAISNGLLREGWHLAWALASFLERFGRLHDWASTQSAALDAAKQLGDWHLQAVAARNIGRAHTMLAQIPLARRYLQRAWVLARRAGDLVQQAHAHLNLAQAADKGPAGYRLSMTHIQHALQLYQLAGHRMGTANALNVAGWISAINGHHRLALDYCRQALELHETIGNTSGQAPTLDSIGYVLHHLGQHSRADAYLRRAFEIACQLGNRYLQAIVLEHLGENQFARGDQTQALNTWRLAIEIFNDLGSPEAEQLQQRLRGNSNRQSPHEK